MLARQRAQREEPLLDLFERARIEFEHLRRAGERGERLGGFGGGALGRGERVVEEALGPVAGALEPAQRAGQRLLRAAVAIDLGDRLGNRLAEPLGILQEGAAGAEPLLLVAFGRDRVEFGAVMAQQILLGPALGEAARGFLGPPPRRPPLLPEKRQRGRHDFVLGNRVEQEAVRRRVEQAALLALALDLDEAVAELAQQPDARRLVIDKGAAAPVGADHAAHHDRAGKIAGNAGLAQHRRGRMIGLDRELGGDRGLLGAGPHQARIGAPAERQPERIEQNRFARPGLARSARTAPAGRRGSGGRSGRHREW